MFKRNQKHYSQADLPSIEKDPERYKGRPLLIVLENYVLDCIGELSPEQQEGLTALVQQVFGGQSDWKKTIREVLHLEDSMDETIRRLWARNQELARQQQAELHPVQFAKMLVDENFAHLIDKL